MFKDFQAVLDPVVNFLTLLVVYVGFVQCEPEEQGLKKVSQLMVGIH